MSLEAIDHKDEDSCGEKAEMVLTAIVEIMAMFWKTGDKNEVSLKEHQESVITDWCLWLVSCFSRNLRINTPLFIAGLSRCFLF